MPKKRIILLNDVASVSVFARTPPRYGGARSLRGACWYLQSCKSRHDTSGVQPERHVNPNGRGNDRFSSTRNLKCDVRLIPVIERNTLCLSLFDAYATVAKSDANSLCSHGVDQELALAHWSFPRGCVFWSGKISSNYVFYSTMSPVSVEFVPPVSSESAEVSREAFLGSLFSSLCGRSTSWCR